MKKLLSSLMMALGLMASVHAADAPKSPLSLTVKKQVLDADHDMHGAQGSSSNKTLTLRVTVANTTGAVVEASELSGIALMKRAGELREVIVKESLPTVQVKSLKPNESVTLELGKISVREVEWRKRKFEESLEEWKVVCKRGGAVIASAESSDKFAATEQQATPQLPKRGQPKQLRR